MNHMRSIFPVLLIFLAVLIVHFPLLLMDGVYWDDWVLSQFIINGDYGGHFILWKELGLPGFAPIYWAIGSLPPSPQIAHNIVTMILLIASSLLVYRIARTAVEMTKFESLIIAIASGTYTALETTFVFNVTVYMLMLALFLAGTNLAISANKSGNIPARILALALFAISFQHNSLLVYYGGFILLMLIINQRDKTFSLSNCLIRFPLSHIDYFLLPFVFWITREAFWEHIGYYNKFNFSLHNIWTGAQAFAGKGLLEELREVIRHSIDHPFLLAVLSAAALLMWLKFRPKSEELVSKKNMTIAIIVFGILMLLFAIAPYLVVSKAPRSHGYTTRHALLLAIPVGILIVGFLRPLLKNRLTQPVAIIALTATFMGSAFIFWENYLLWQARYVKDLSFITYFADRPELKEVSTFFATDNFKVAPETYRFYEWSGMIYRAWGETGRLVLYDGEKVNDLEKLSQYHPYWKEWYFLESHPKTSCEADLVIERGKTIENISNQRLALKYMTLRFFGNKDEMGKFLRGVIEISVDNVKC